MGEVTGHKARQNAADEAGAGVCRQHTAHKAGNHAGAAGDGLADKGGEDRDHQPHGDTADVFKHSGKGVVLLAGGVEGVDAPQEGDGGEDAARHHKGEHMADAVHQVLINLPAKGLLPGGGGSFRFRGGLAGVQHRHLAVQNPLNQLRRLVDAVPHRGDDGGQAAEPIGVLVLIRGDDDANGVPNILWGEDVLRPGGAVGLHLNLHPQLLGGGFQGFLRHKGVGDSGRTACNCQNLLCHTTLPHFSYS